MPSTTVFRGFAARLQANIDGLFEPPAAPAPAPAPAPPLGHQIEGQRQEGGPAADGTRPNPGVRQQGEPDPVATAARLVQEHRQRHPDALRDTLGRVERAVGLFMATLIPGVGERHVRAREEARREMERAERERVERVAAEEEGARRLAEEDKADQEEKRGEISGRNGEAAGDASGSAGKGHIGLAGSAAQADRKDKDTDTENPVPEESLVEI